MTQKRLSLGKHGEKLACKFLKKKGYKILEKNYRGRLGEIDLVARDGNCLVFVEVKTRSSTSHGHPLESIGPRKQHQLVKAAREYLAGCGGEERECRFDAVSVILSDGGSPRVELVSNAFEIEGLNFR